MTDLRTAAWQAVEACEQRLPLVGQARIIGELNALRTALAEPVRDAELSAALGWPGGVSTPELDRKRLLQMVAALRVSAQQAEPPPEAVTEAEKIAYAAGWWAAMAKGGSNPPPLRAEPKSLPCPAPRRCGEGCGGWCGPRAEAKA